MMMTQKESCCSQTTQFEQLETAYLNALDELLSQHPEARVVFCAKLITTRLSDAERHDVAGDCLEISRKMKALQGTMLLLGIA